MVRVHALATVRFRSTGRSIHCVRLHIQFERERPCLVQLDDRPLLVVNVNTARMHEHRRRELAQLHLNAAWLLSLAFVAHVRRDLGLRDVFAKRLEHAVRVDHSQVETSLLHDGSADRVARALAPHRLHLFELEVVLHKVRLRRALELACQTIKPSDHVLVCILLLRGLCKLRVHAIDAQPIGTEILFGLYKPTLAEIKRGEDALQLRKERVVAARCLGAQHGVSQGGNHVHLLGHSVCVARRSQVLHAYEAGVAASVAGGHVVPVLNLR
mmetsp:Transcript_23692/g.82416  ORF Transcript_23692/g.82416 Transcript_23692/m.82416 type:complete len:270 (-) Transcript_23692:205-1014(-)